MADDGRDLDYTPIHRLLTSRKRAADPSELRDWRGRELASLGWLLGRRLARGLLLAQRLRSAQGAIFCERNVRVLHGRHVTAGRDLNLEEGVYIIGLSKRGIVFGDRVSVGRFAIIQPTNALGGEPGEGMRVGDNSNIGAFAFVGCSGYIDIGSRVLMGPRVTLLAENHLFDDHDLPIKDQGIERRHITIEDDCWLGADSTIVAGVTVGRGSVVAAGAVVTRDVPESSVVAGVPARVVRRRGGDDPGVTAS